MSRILLLKRTGLSSVLASSLAGIALLGGSGAFAQTITITDPPGISVSTTGAVTETGSNNIQFSQPEANKVHLFGTAPDTFTSSGGNGTIIADIMGTANTTEGDNFIATYDFTLGLTGSGNVSYTLEATGTANILGFSIAEQIFSKSSTTPLQGPTGPVLESGSVTDTIPISGTFPFDAQLQVTWDDASAGNTLTVDVPDTSIDLSVVTPTVVPEPSAVPLVALGILGFFGWRRFAARRRSA
jgi:hypothetical protein